MLTRECMCRLLTMTAVDHLAIITPHTRAVFCTAERELEDFSSVMYCRALLQPCSLLHENLLATAVLMYLGGI